MKQNKLQKILEQEAEKFIKESKNRIPKILENATLSLLGLEKNYQGNYEIDHCNGRNSVLIDAFKRLATTEAEKIAKSYRPSATDIAGFVAAFEREYKSQMNYIIRDLARERAKKDVAAEVEKLTLDIKKMIEESNDK